MPLKEGKLYKINHLNICYCVSIWENGARTYRLFKTGDKILTYEKLIAGNYYKPCHIKIEKDVLVFVKVLSQPFSTKDVKCLFVHNGEKIVVVTDDCDPETAFMEVL